MGIFEMIVFIVFFVSVGLWWGERESSIHARNVVRRVTRKIACIFNKIFK